MSLTAEEQALVAAVEAAPTVSSEDDQYLALSFATVKKCVEETLRCVNTSADTEDEAKFMAAFERQFALLTYEQKVKFDKLKSYYLLGVRCCKYMDEFVIDRPAEGEKLLAGDLEDCVYDAVVRKALTSNFAILSDLEAFVMAAWTQIVAQMPPANWAQHRSLCALLYSGYGLVWRLYSEVK